LRGLNAGGELTIISVSLAENRLENIDKANKRFAKMGAIHPLWIIVHDSILRTLLAGNV